MSEFFENSGLFGILLMLWYIGDEKRYNCTFSSALLICKHIDIYNISLKINKYRNLSFYVFTQDYDEYVLSYTIQNLLLPTFIEQKTLSLLLLLIT